MKAQKQVLDEQREEKERKEQEEAAEKERQRQDEAAANVEYPSAPAKKKRHLGFAERAEQRMLEAEEKQNQRDDQMLIQEQSETVLQHLWPEAANI